MPYTFLNHATDALVEVSANTMNDALEDAAYATIDIMLSRESVRPVAVRTVTTKSDTMHDLLYGWLEEIIYQTITEGFAVKKVKAAYEHRSGHHTVVARLEGEMLDVQRHQFKIEVKAPTYHEMSILNDDMVRMRFLMDL